MPWSDRKRNSQARGNSTGANSRTYLWSKPDFSLSFLVCRRFGHREAPGCTWALLQPWPHWLPWPRAAVATQRSVPQKHLRDSKHKPLARLSYGKGEEHGVVCQDGRAAFITYRICHRESSLKRSKLSKWSFQGIEGIPPPQQRGSITFIRKLLVIQWQCTCTWVTSMMLNKII